MTATLPRTNNGQRAEPAEFDLGPPAVPPGRKVKVPEIAVALFIVIAVAAGAALWASTGQSKRPVIALRNPVHRGDVISIDDLMRVELASDDRLATIPDGQSSSIVGKAAAMDMATGTVLTNEMFSATGALSSGQAVVGLVLEQGEIPTVTMGAGDTVDVVLTSKDGSDDPAGSVLVRGATIRDVVEHGDQGAKFVSLAVSVDDAPKVSSASAAKRVRLVQVAPR